MNIVLIGMRGSGKTTIAKLLSKRMGKNMIEMDDWIVQKAGKSIPEIVEQNGWDSFRDLESDLVEEISKLNDMIISTGGGVILRPKNIELLKKNGKIFLLTVSVDTLLKRIGDDPNRPSLTGKQSRRKDMEEVLTQRIYLYKQAADAILDTEMKNEQVLVEEIISSLQKKGIKSHK